MQSIINLDSPEGAALIGRAAALFARGMYPGISTIQRELQPGYSVATAILGRLEKAGMVSAIQADGQRRYFGEGAQGRKAFEAFAAELRAGIEPAAHWWKNLGPSARRKYLPGVNEAGDWCDLSAVDQGKMRLRFAKNLDAKRALDAQFCYMGARAAA